jgi:pimeloyl-ACP methyl ester carboxylesterase
MSRTEDRTGGDLREGYARVERLPEASHWVHHDEHERVTQLLIEFFASALPTENR